MKKNWISEAIARADMSLNERMDIIRRALSARFNQGPGDYCYCEVFFDDYVIVNKNQKLWRVDLTWNDDGTVTLGDEPQQVRIAYPAVQEAAADGRRFEGQVIGLLPDGDPVTEGEQPAKPTGKKWGVLIITEGMSKNRNRYSRKVLTEAAPLYEGAQVFIDHEEKQRRFGRSAKDLAGFLKDVNPALISTQTKEGADGQPILALAATMVVTKPAIRQEILDAYEEGNPNLMGLSHDAMCRSVTTMDGNQEPFYDVTKIEAVSSVDLVTNAAAGGRVLRLVASDTVAHTLEGDGKMLTKMIEAIKASKNAGLIAKLEALGATPNEDQVMAIYSDALTGAAPKTEATQPAAVTTPATTTVPAQPAATTTAQPTQTTENVVRVPEAEWRETRIDGRTQFLESSLAGCALPVEIKDRLRQRFVTQMAGPNGLIPSKEAILDAIKADVDLWAKLAERNLVLPVTAQPRIDVGAGKREKSQEAFDEFFGVKKDAAVRGGYRLVESADRRLMSFRNLYAEVTGDRDVTGRTKEAVRLTEALDTTSFGEILGDSITRRMLAEYAMGSQAAWRGIIADVVPVSDMRTQRRMRFGGYGNLSIVAQGAPYAALTSPTDEEATYAAAKRGGTEEITLEMILNDDVGAIRRIPTKLAKAAQQTLYEFVFDFMRTNAAVYDSVALAAAGHGTNISSTALSNTQLGILRLAIRNQTDMSNGKRLGLATRYLWVPPDLEELAFWLCTSDRALPDTSIPGTAASGAPNFQRKLGITPMTVDYWTDTNNYWVTSSVSDTPMIEIGFLNGREEPEIFVQDMPNVGSMFSNDKLTYKIRHIYGGAVVDYRGFAGGIV